MSTIAEVLTLLGAGTVPPRDGAKMLCPFHDDSKPSATVNHATGKFHCFGCSIHEDAIGLLMRFGGRTFGEAKSEVAKISGTGGDPVSGVVDRGEWLPGITRDTVKGGGGKPDWRSGLA